MSNQLRPAHGAAWVVAELAGTHATSLVTFVVLARMLEASAFGLIALASALTALAAAILDQGLGAALIQRSKLETAHIDSAFWLNLVGGVLLAIAMICLAAPISSWFQEPQLAPIVQWMSLRCILVALTTTQQALMQRAMKFRELAARTMMGEVCGGIAGVGAALSGFGAWALVVQGLVFSGVSTIALWSIADWRPRMRFSLRHAKELYSFGKHVFLTQLLRATDQRLPDFVVGGLLGADTLGIFRVATRTAETLTTLSTTVIKRVLFPAFSALSADRLTRHKAFNTAWRVVGLFGLPLFAIGAYWGPSVVSVVYGHQWARSGDLLPYLVPVGLLTSMQAVLGALILADGRSGIGLAARLVNTLGVAASVAIGSQWGLTGVAVAIFANSLVIESSVFLAGASRSSGIRLTTTLALLSGPLVASALALACDLTLGSRIRATLDVQGLLISGRPWLGLVSGVSVSILFFAGAYTAALAAFWPDDLSEAKRFLAAFVPRLAPRTPV